MTPVCVENTGAVIPVHAMSTMIGFSVLCRFRRLSYSPDVLQALVGYLQSMTMYVERCNGWSFKQGTGNAYDPFLEGFPGTLDEKKSIYNY